MKTTLHGISGVSLVGCALLFGAACSNDHGSDTPISDNLDVVDDTTSGRDTSSQENTDTTTDSGVPDTALTPDAADSSPLDDTGDDIEEDPVDTRAEDADAGGEPQEDTEAADTSDGEDTLESDTVTDTGEPTLTELWERECGESVRIYCDQLFDSECDGDEYVERTRSNVTVMHQDLTAMDACIETVYFYFCAWLEEPALGDEVSIDVAASEACNAGLESLSCAQYLDNDVKNELVECDPLLVGRLSHGEPCTVHHGCPSGDYCEGSDHTYNWDTSSWEHQQGVCAARHGEGEECVDTMACADGLTCANRDGVVACRPEG